MAYIEKDKVKKIREEIKKAFPKPYVWSVTWEHYSTVNIVLKAGPMQVSEDLTKGHCVNPYHIDREPKELKELGIKVYSIVREIAPVSYHETGDYGNQPNYYCYFYLGKYDKAYSVTP